MSSRRSVSSREPGGGMPECSASTAAAMASFSVDAAGNRAFAFQAAPTPLVRLCDVDTRGAAVAIRERTELPGEAWIVLCACEPRPRRGGEGVDVPDGARRAAAGRRHRRHADRDVARRQTDPEPEAPSAELPHRDDAAVRGDDHDVGVPGGAAAHEPVRHLVRRRLLERRRGKRRSGIHDANDRAARPSGCCRGRPSSLGAVVVSPMRIFAHLDLDAFFAAVEELEDPALRAKPVVVGGDPHSRGVVATANYAARAFGIHSAMSAAEALRRCPHAVFLRPRHALYRQYSRAVWETVAEIVPRIERTGVDEGYLDLGAVATDFTRARAVASAVQTSVRATTSLTCSLGVGTSKVVCKIASDRRKPGGITVVPPGTRGTVPGPAGGAAPARGRPPCGGTARERRDRDDRRTGRPRRCRAGVAPSGLRGRLLRDRARGIDPRDLELAGETLSVSAEDTFARDVSDRDVLHAEVRRLAELVAVRLRDSGLSGRTVTAKLRYGDFSIRTRSTTLAAGVEEAEVIGTVACQLLDRGLRDRPGALRLVGVGVSGLAAHRQLTLDEA